MAVSYEKVKDISHVFMCSLVSWSRRKEKEKVVIVVVVYFHVRFDDAW